MAISVRISSAALDAILVHAASSDEEVCGLLLAPLCPREGGDPVWAPAFAGEHDVGTVVACANVHPTPATHFELDPAALLAAHRAARHGGPALLGHYHSHPSGLAEPSAIDAAHAPPDGALWLIVADGSVSAWRAVPNGARLKRFDPMAIVTT